MSDTPPSATAEEPIAILIVDDEPRNLTVLETVLDDPAYRLVRANSGEEALAALVAQDFALLILDIQMPGMTGFEVAQMVRQRRRSAATPIIFLTAYFSEDQHVLEGYGAGAVDYLHKPIRPAVLRSKVAVFAELYRKSRALTAANRRLAAEAEALEARVAERTAALTASEALLREADRRKDEFLATLAHELRNPLAPIRNGLRVLELADDAETQVETRRMMARQLAHMVRLIDDLLDVSRINTGKVTLRRGRASLKSIVEAAIEASRHAVEAAAHELEVRVAAEAVWLDADATRITQAVANLLTNAAKYTPDGGRVAIEAGLEGGEAVVRVTDTGLGIPGPMLESVFEMFTQVNRTLDRSQGGLGIGLALVRRLVEMHGGSVSVASPGAGAGSTFTIRLPVSPAAEAAEATPAGDGGVSRGRRVLVVDDNADSADSLVRLLTLYGHDARAAYGGAAALEAARARRPDVVFLDLGMPDVDGYEAAARLRADPLTLGVTLVALTGWGGDADKEKTRAAGFDAHLTKPVEAGAVEALLDRLPTPAPVTGMAS